MNMSHSVNKLYTQQKCVLRGFTLLEIMIALVVFSIIAVILSTSLYTIFNARDKMNAKADSLAQLQLAMSIIARDTQQVVNRTSYTDTQQIMPGLYGNQEQLSFTRAGYTNPFGLQPRSELQRVSYFAKGKQLIRQTWPRLDIAANAKVTQRVLLDGVETLSFGYLNQDNEMVPIWSSFGRRGLPKATQMNITLHNEGKLSLLLPTVSKSREAK